MNADQYVAVRKAGPNHREPDAWLRMDASGSEQWSPQDDLQTVVRRITTLRANVKRTTTLAVMQLGDGHWPDRIIWTEDDQPPTLGSPLDQPLAALPPEQLRLL